MISYFSPLDKKAEEAQKRGEDVNNPCRYCGNDFFSHTNGKCPKARKRTEHVTAHS